MGNMLYQFVVTTCVQDEEDSPTAEEASGDVYTALQDFDFQVLDVRGKTCTMTDAEMDAVLRSVDEEGDDVVLSKHFHSGKALGNTDQNETRKNVKDVVIFGDDLFRLLSKASSQSEGWMKSTKAMEVKGGCVVQVTTQQRNPDGSYSVAEAVTFVPDVCIVRKEVNGVLVGRSLKCIYGA